MELHERDTVPLEHLLFKCPEIKDVEDDKRPAPFKGAGLCMLVALFRLRGSLTACSCADRFRLRRRCAQCHRLHR